jgi:hypothetical protein
LLNSFFSLLIFVSVLFSIPIFAQGDNSFQINGGIIMPMSSSKGLTTSIQFNYKFNPIIELYGYVGYSSWDKYNITYHEDYSPIQKQQYFKTYSADNHILVPIYLGGKVNFNTNKLFTSFINFELGYSHLSYNSFNNFKSVDPETGEVLGYRSDFSTKKEVSENLFGIGIGAGLSHPMTESLDLVLSFKLNSYINSNYYGLFSTRGTYSMFLAGFNFKI